MNEQDEVAALQASGEVVGSLRERLAQAIYDAEWGARREREQPWSAIQGVDRDEYLAQADAALAAVTPELERRDAEIARLESVVLEKQGLFQGWRLAAMEDRRQKLELWAERDALRAHLADALEGMEDMVGYVSDYFR